MSNFIRSAYHPRENVIRSAHWLDDYFSPHVYGVSFPGDDHVYTTEEVIIPLDVVFVPAAQPEQTIAWYKEGVTVEEMLDHLSQPKARDRVP